MIHNEWRQLSRQLRLIQQSLEAIRKQIESVAEKAEPQADTTEAQPTKIVVSEIADTALPVTIREHYESERRDEPRKKWRRRLKWALEFGGLLILGSYTVSTWKTLNEIGQQTKLAESENRPWIKVIEVRPEPNPQLPILSFFKSVDIFVGGPQPMASLHVEFLIKNIGKSVAQNIAIFPELFFHPNGQGPNVAAEEERYCQSDWPKLKMPPAFSWSALFPGEELRARMGISQPILNSQVQHRDGVDYVDGELIGCVSYQHPRNYQTRVAYMIRGDRLQLPRFGTDLDIDHIRLMRDEHAEYAQ